MTTLLQLGVCLVDCFLCHESLSDEASERVSEFSIVSNNPFITFRVFTGLKRSIDHIWKCHRIVQHL